MPAAQMPGMATEAQLRRAGGVVSGASADELFVSLMTPTTRAASHMAEYAVDDAGLAKVRSMAQSMITGQRGDIVEMRPARSA